jgi:hypothetical protein
MESQPSDSIDISFLEELTNALPLRFKAIHLLSVVPVPEDKKAQFNFGDKVYVHVGASKGELLSKLETFGMSKDGLPRSLNGGWGYQKFLYWQELRTRMEWKIPLGSSGREYAGVKFPAIKPYSVLPEDEKTERQRRLNVIHCRRKRNRVLGETEILQEQCGELRDEREVLLEENRKLEALLKAALTTVQLLEEEESSNKYKTAVLSSVQNEKSPNVCGSVSADNAALISSTGLLLQTIMWPDLVEEASRASQWESQEEQLFLRLLRRRET